MLVADEVVEDGHLSTHVRHVIDGNEFGFGDGFAARHFSRGFLLALVDGAELTRAELATKAVHVLDELWMGGGGRRMRNVQFEGGERVIYYYYYYFFYFFFRLVSQLIFDPH